MKPVVHIATEDMESAQLLEQPDYRFPPSHITLKGRSHYEGVSYTLNGTTGEVIWSPVDKKDKIKQGDVVAFHF